MGWILKCESGPQVLQNVSLTKPRRGEGPSTAQTVLKK